MPRVGWWMTIIFVLILSGAMASEVTAHEANRSSERSAMALGEFIATFDAVPGLPADYFSETLGGIQFDFTFTSEGDGGNGQGIAFDDAFGEDNSSSLNLWSAALNLTTEERITITRNDGQYFTFSSLFVNNTAAGETVTVAGYKDGALVGTEQTAPNGTFGTLSFGDPVVDEVRLTSSDFANTNIDSFAGSTEIPTAVALSQFQVVDLQPTVPAVWFLLLGLAVTTGGLVAKRYIVALDNWCG